MVLNFSRPLPTLFITLLICRSKKRVSHVTSMLLCFDLVLGQCISPLPLPDSNWNWQLVALKQHCTGRGKGSREKLRQNWALWKKWQLPSRYLSIDRIPIGKKTKKIYIFCTDMDPIRHQIGAFLLESDSQKPF